MDKTYLPQTEHYLIMSWKDLEIAWRMLTAPSKAHRIDDTLQTVQHLAQECGPEKAIFTIVAATAWLTDDRPSSMDGWKA